MLVSIMCLERKLLCGITYLILKKNVHIEEIVTKTKSIPHRGCRKLASRKASEPPKNTSALMKFDKILLIEKRNIGLADSKRFHTGQLRRFSIDLKSVVNSFLRSLV